MFAQNLFYYTVSSAIIIMALFVCIVMIYCLIIMRRVDGIVSKTNKILETLKEKVKISAFMGLMTQGIKEVTEFVKEQRKK